VTSLALLLRAVAEGFLAAVFAGGVLVWLYNRYLAGLRESYVKKGMSLSTLPLAVLAGAAHAAALWKGWPVLSIAALPGFVILVYKAYRYRRRTLLNQPAQTENLPAPPRGINYPYYRFPVRFGLKAIEPINDVSRLQLHRSEFQIPGLPAEFDGYRILFLTDFHVHPTLSPDYFRHLASLAREIKADALFLGGDFISKRQIGRAHV